MVQVRAVDVKTLARTPGRLPAVTSMLRAYLANERAKRGCEHRRAVNCQPQFKFKKRRYLRAAGTRRKVRRPQLVGRIRRVNDSAEGYASHRSD